MWDLKKLKFSGCQQQFSGFMIDWQPTMNWEFATQEKPSNRWCTASNLIDLPNHKDTGCEWCWPWEPCEPWHRSIFDRRFREILLALVRSRGRWETVGNGDRCFAELTTPGGPGRPGNLRPGGHDSASGRKWWFVWEYCRSCFYEEFEEWIKVPLCSIHIWYPIVSSTLHPYYIHIRSILDTYHIHVPSIFHPSRDGLKFGNQKSHRWSDFHCRNSMPARSSGRIEGGELVMLSKMITWLGWIWVYIIV